MPGCVDIVGMGTTIDIYDGGILLSSVEVGRLHHPVIEVCDTVCRLDAAHFENGLLVIFPGILGLVQLIPLPVRSLAHIDIQRYLWCTVFLVYLFA